MCAAEFSVYPQRDRQFLMPLDMRDWLPEDDLVFVVLDAVANLDLDAFVAHIGPTVTAERRSGDDGGAAAAAVWLLPG